MDIIPIRFLVTPEQAFYTYLNVWRMVVEIFFSLTAQDLHTSKNFKQRERERENFFVKGVLYDDEVKSCRNSFKQFLKSHVHSHS